MCNTGKSSGIDYIGARQVQLRSAVIAENSTKMFNNAMAKGEYPAQLEIANVCKKEEKYNLGNYRPKTLLLR